MSQSFINIKTGLLPYRTSIKSMCMVFWHSLAMRKALRLEKLPLFRWIQTKILDFYGDKVHCCLISVKRKGKIWIQLLE